MRQDRILYFDNMRLLVILLVVVMHAAVTYSGLGDWYYKEPLHPGMGSIVAFAIFQCFLQAFFMGALFMVAGYFAAGSLRSKGRPAFIKGRFIRLGLPVLFYMLVIQPLTVYFLVAPAQLGDVSFWEYSSRYVATFRFLGGTGPMWFALALLIFCVIYALAARPTSGKRECEPVTIRTAVLLALLASVSAFLIRIVQPIGESVMNMQLCYFAQYVILFVFGIMARERGWFDSLDYRLSKRLIIVSFAILPLLPLLFVAGGALSGNKDAMFGGFHWQSLAYSTWESFTGVFMSIGLLGALKMKANGQNRLVATLSGASFATYMFHAPVLISISLLLRPVVLPAIPKFLLVVALAAPASFLVGLIVRRVPVLRELTPS